MLTTDLDDFDLTWKESKNSFSKKIQPRKWKWNIFEQTIEEKTNEKDFSLATSFDGVNNQF